MLLAPTVVPPITPWSRSIRTKGQHVGANVAVFADGQRIGTVLADSADTFVPIDPNIKLQPGQKIDASQEIGGVTSSATAKTSMVTVLKAPTSAALATIFSRAPLSECGTCLWLEGVVPGADVTVQIGVAVPITVAAEWTAVHVDVPKIGASEKVFVRQGKGTVVGPAVGLPFAQPKPPGDVVQPPRLAEPLVACARALELSQVLPGARITVDHEGDVTTFCFGAASGTLWLARRLEFGHRVTVRQAYPFCELRGSAARYDVTEHAPPTPWFPNPVCAGDRDVEVGGLLSGAVMQLLIGKNGGTIASGTAGGEPPHRFNLPPVGNVKQLGVRQRLCSGGPWSETTWTTLVQVGSHDNARIDDPVHECATAVGVTGLSAGTRVYVVSKNHGGPIGNVVSEGHAFTDVTLLFRLQTGDSLSLELVRCGKLRIVGDDVPVKTLPDEILPPLIYAPLDDTGGIITVARLVPGAFCDVERLNSQNDNQGVLIASQAVTRSQASVAVPPLPPGTFIRCRQRLCDRVSRPSLVVKAGDRPLEYEPWSADRIVALTGVRGHGMRPARYNTTDAGLTGTDLGIPVIHSGRLYFFFGDCEGPRDDDINNHVMPGDADPIAWTTDLPDRPGGPYLHFLMGSGGYFHRLHVDGLPPLENFEVPTGAFSYQGRLYVFVAREKEGGDKMRTSHLAVTKQGSSVYDTLELLYDVASTLPKDPPPPAGRWLVHVSPTVIRCEDWPGLPKPTGDGLIMFGSELYHESNLFLAFCPLETTTVSVPLGPMGPATYVPTPVPHPSKWLYYVDKAPKTIDFPANWRPTSALPVEGPTPLLQNWGGLGEISVTWNPLLRRWLTAHQGSSFGTITVRSARAPCGPWSAPETVFDGLNPANQATADNLVSGHQFVGLENEGSEGGLTPVYAPYLVPTWTRFDRSIRVATIFYTLSTGHPPYNVQLMKARLKFR